MDLLRTMATLGHLASRRQLVELSFSRRTIDQALASKTLLPVRPGWVATPDANQLAITAVLQGAQLTASTALRSYAVWAGSDYLLHLRVPRNSHRIGQAPLTPVAAFTPPKFLPRGTVRHWTTAAAAQPRQPAWRVSVRDALVEFARSESLEQTAAAIENAVYEKRLTRTEVTAVFARLPRRVRRIRARLNFCAESGLETVCRVRLENLGYAVTQQVRIGPDRVDIVIDGWLVVELDGDIWHDPIADRRRTNRLIRAGYRVLRFGHDDLFYGWQNVLETIRELLGERVAN